MSKVEQLGAEIVKLPPEEQQQLRDMLDDIVEDRLEFADEFRAKIEQSERDMAAGKPGRVRKPEDKP